MTPVASCSRNAMLPEGRSPCVYQSLLIQRDAASSLCTIVAKFTTVCCFSWAGISLIRSSAERLWGRFFILVWQMLENCQIPAKFSSELFSFVSPGLRPPPKKNSRPRFTPKIVGQFRIFEPNNFSYQFLLTMEIRISDLNYRYRCRS